MITDRDIKVIEWLDREGNNFKVATTSTIANMFYPSLLVTQKRLKAMFDDKQIRRFRYNITNEYCYYPKRLPKNLKHSLTVSGFVGELSKYVNVVYSQAEYNIADLRADALLGVECNNKKFLIFVEVEISNNQFNMQKYINLYNSNVCGEVLGTFPVLLVISNKTTIAKSDLFRVIQIREDFTDIEKLLKVLA